MLMLGCKGLTITQNRDRYQQWKFLLQKVAPEISF